VRSNPKSHDFGYVVLLLSILWLAMHAPVQAAEPTIGAQGEAARWTRAKFGGLAESPPGAATGRPPLTTEPPFSFTYDGKSFRDLAWKSARASRQGLDWYREDMNGGGPCPAWRKNDAPDRQGITENLYVQGHLAFWDELRRRHPRLRIDSCASRGRRNDLETMRRAVPLLRSDFQHPHMPSVVEGNQAHTYGLSFWLPFQGTGGFSADPYVCRKDWRCRSQSSRAPR
jgi:hypothetical protein